MKMVSLKTLALAAAVFLFFTAPHAAQAQKTDCLACHGDTTMQDAAGHNVGVPADTFHSSIHGSLECSNCHTTIKD